MHQAGCLPFESARACLERARDERANAISASEAGASGGMRCGKGLLHVIRDVLRQAVHDKGRDWLNVYGKRYATHELDGLVL